MNMQTLSIYLANSYHDTHELGWFVYVQPDGTKVLTDDLQEVYIAHKQIAELDKKRDEITKQLILDALKNKTKY